MIFSCFFPKDFELIYQIHAFVKQINKTFNREIPEFLDWINDCIIKSQPRPEILKPFDSSASRRNNRFVSAEPLGFPYQWSTDIGIFRKITKQLNNSNQISMYQNHLLVKQYFQRKQYFLSFPVLSIENQSLFPNTNTGNMA